MTVEIIDGLPTYIGETFKIVMHRYTDPHRLNAARNAAIYLGKKDRDNIRRPLNIIREGHVAEVFRGENAEFEFIDVSKEVYDHIVTYTTRDMRVAGGNRAMTSDNFTMPSDKVKNPELVREKIQGSMDNYKELLEAGETPQVSRTAMPTSAKLNPFVYKFNFLTLGQSVFKQRIWEKGAQGNTVKVVRGMYELCAFMDKELWDIFYEWCGEPATEWVEARRKLKKGQFRNANKETVQIGTVKEFMDALSKIDPDKNTEEAIRELLGSARSMW